MSEDQQKNDEDDGELSPRFYDGLNHLQSVLGRGHSPNNEEDAYCERTPLLNSGTHSRPVTPSSGTGHGIYSGLSRSISVHSVSGATESSSGSSSDVSVSRLSSSQKKVLVLTAIADLLAYLSLSIMAPFFPEEVILNPISCEYMYLIFMQFKILKPCHTYYFCEFDLGPLIYMAQMAMSSRAVCDNGISSISVVF